MPEIKNTFTQGKMNKDLNERLVPKGQYVDAMNVEAKHIWEYFDKRKQFNSPKQCLRWVRSGQRYRLFVLANRYR